MHVIIFKAYCRKDKLLISIILQTTQTNLLMSSVSTNELKSSRKAKDVMHAGVGMDTHGSITIPLQLKEKFFENSSPSLQNSDLISVLLHSYLLLFPSSFPQHTSNKLHLTSSWWVTYILTWEHHHCWLHLKAYCTGNSHERFAHAVVFFWPQSLLAAHSTGASQRNFIRQGRKVDGWFLPVHTHYSAGFVQVLPAAQVWI